MPRARGSAESGRTERASSLLLLLLGARASSDASRSRFCRRRARRCSQDWGKSVPQSCTRRTERAAKLLVRPSQRAHAQTSSRRPSGRRRTSSRRLASPPLECLTRFQASNLSLPALSPCDSKSEPRGPSDSWSLAEPDRASVASSFSTLAAFPVPGRSLTHCIDEHTSRSGFSEKVRPDVSARERASERARRGAADVRERGRTNAAAMSVPRPQGQRAGSVPLRCLMQRAGRERAARPRNVDVRSSR